MVELARYHGEQADSYLLALFNPELVEMTSDKKAYVKFYEKLIKKFMETRDIADPKAKQILSVLNRKTEGQIDVLVRKISRELITE